MKKFLIVLLVVALIGSATIVYLNKVYLPAKIKSLVVQKLQEITRKKVSLDTISFNILKGLVLRGLKVYDEKETILSVKEASCTFLIWPIFNKKIIFPTMNFDTPVLFLNRRQDNTWNIADLFPSGKARNAKSGFGVFIYRVSLKRGRIDFRDDALPSPFSKRLENINVVMHLSLPARIKFNLSSVIAAEPNMLISGSGEFRIPDRQLRAKAKIEDFSPGEFLAYYQKTGILVSEGSVNALISLNLKKNIFSIELKSQEQNLAFSKDKISGLLNCAIETTAQYDIVKRELTCNGKANISQSQLSGIELIGDILGINGDVVFSDKGLSSDNITAVVLDTPVEGKVKMENFKSPLLVIQAKCGLGLAKAQAVLADKFQVNFPAKINGDAKLSATIETRLPAKSIPDIKGSLDVSGATLTPENAKPLENINGRFDFTRNRLQWSSLNFTFQDKSYTTGGTLTDFRSPLLDLELTSDNLSLKSTFKTKDRIIVISNFTGTYFNSKFSFEGAIDTTEPARWDADITGGLDIDLRDGKDAFSKFRERLEPANLSGLMHVIADIDGNIRDFKTCSVQAQATSPSLSAYGLKGSDFTVNYSQNQGVADIEIMQLLFYGGMINGSARINLASLNLPYRINASMQDVKLEKLIADVPAKTKDISGTIEAAAVINGFSGDLSKLNGSGKILITDGKLWNLDLFKGLGALLFSREDFTDIVFTEGSCDMFIRDKAVTTDNLKLKSSFVELSGPCRVGFDGSLEGSIDVVVLDELAPIKGTLKDLTTAIVGKAGRFGVIELSGTLKEPKYKFKAAVVDIIKSIKDTFLGNIFE